VVGRSDRVRSDVADEHHETFSFPRVKIEMNSGTGVGIEIEIEIKINFRCSTDRFTTVHFVESFGQKSQIATISSL
jgi:hypothetical protein